MDRIETSFAWVRKCNCSFSENEIEEGNYTTDSIGVPSCTKCGRDWEQDYWNTQQTFSKQDMLDFAHDIAIQFHGEHELNWELCLKDFLENKKRK